MKLRDIFVLFTLSVMVKGFMWYSMAEPVLVAAASFLTACAIQEFRPEWISMLGKPFANIANKLDKKEPEPVAKEAEQNTNSSGEKFPEYKGTAEEKLKDEAELARLRKKYFVEEGLTYDERKRLLELYEKLEEPEDNEMQIDGPDLDKKDSNVKDASMFQDDM